MADFRISDLWLFRKDGTVSREVYAGVGLVGFAIKHNLDRFLASAVFHRPWALFNYLDPADLALDRLTPEHLKFLLTILALAIPFIWVGVNLTLRRLRSAHLPWWLVMLFFCPLVNLIFFITLALVPPASEELPAIEAPDSRLLNRLVPSHPVGAALVSVLLVVPVALGFTAMSVSGMGEYGWSLFVGLPFMMGLGSVLIYGYHKERSYPACLAVSMGSVAVLGLMLLALAVEGILCIAMAAPLGLMLGAMGGSVGYLIQRRPTDGKNRVLGSTSVICAGLIASWPVISGAERQSHTPSPTYAVTSEVVVNARPEQIWPRVIQFSRLKPPTELIFKLGVAYPVIAKLDGQGVGAMRRCIFSTGHFLEPITVWDEPHHLKFGVLSNPAPMQEWTPYGDLHTAHTEQDYMVSEGGEFRLVDLGNGQTKLQGTTWYHHGLWPAPYWRVWSDSIIHTIHLRVLNHIKSETETSSSS